MRRGPDRLRHRLLLALVLLHVAIAAGCGKKASPLPPEPRGPHAPREVGARQVGGRILVAFLVPEARGSKAAQQPLVAELIRVAYPVGLDAPVDPGAFRRRGVVVHRVQAEPLPSGTRMILADEQIDELPDSGVGSILRYAVRVRDRRLRSSPLVMAEDLVPLPAAEAPTRLQAEPTADGVRLVWEPPSATEELRYNVYRSNPDEAEPQVPLNASPLDLAEFLDSDVTRSSRYRYFVRVALADGRPYREGRTSVPLEIVARDLFAPGVPRGLVAVQEGRAVRLFWNPSPERDVAGYRIYRRVDSGAWHPVGAGLSFRPSYRDDDVQPGRQVTYRVTAIDRADPPNESEASESRSLRITGEP